MCFEAIDELYALDNYQRQLDFSEAKLDCFESQNAVFVQNLLFLVRCHFSYFSGFLCPFGFEFFSKVIESYFGIVK